MLAMAFITYLCLVEPMHCTTQSTPNEPLCSIWIVEESNFQRYGALPQVNCLNVGVSAPVPHINAAAIMP